MHLTPEEICRVARGAGFSDEKEISPGVSEVACMCAIALRESGGDPSAFNGNSATGDRSYGLWQINLKDTDIDDFLICKFPELRLSEEWLLVPENNAAAAYALYRGKIAFLDLLWYINRTGTPYQERYAANLPTAKAAAFSTMA